MTIALLAIQATLLVLLVRRGCRPLWFMIAVAFVVAENAVYEAGNVAVGMHSACGVARLLAGAEAVWLLTRGSTRRVAAVVGIGIAAVGGGMALIQAKMQYNLAHPWMWRALGVGWASIAVGLIIALCSAYRWRLGLPWMRGHSLIAAAYFSEQALTYFIPLGKGQGTQWDIWYEFHGFARLAVWGAWACLFWKYRTRKPHYRSDKKGPCYG